MSSKFSPILDRFCSWTCSVIKAWRDDKGRPHPERFVFSRWERRAWPFDGEVGAHMLELRVIVSPWWWGGNSKSAKEQLGRRLGFFEMAVVLY